MSSADYEWDTNRRERFVLGMQTFDVRKAKEIINATPHEIETIDVSKTHPEDAVKVRPDFAADPNIDVNLPVIVAETSFGSAIIDGWHRVAKAKANGQNQVYAVRLTEEESAQIKLT